MNGKKLFGIILIILGVLIFLETSNLVEFDFDIGDIISNYWPLILVLLGLSNLLSSSRSKTGGVILITIGILLQLKIMGLLEFDIMMPIIIILIGFYILFFSNRKSHFHFHNSKLTEDTIDGFVLFSGISKKILSNNFKGGSATTIFGAMDIDLRDANIEKNLTVRLDLFTIFGGTDVFVPQNWNIEVTGVPIFGAWDNLSRNKIKIPDAPTLKVNCIVILGGIDIKN